MHGCIWNTIWKGKKQILCASIFFLFVSKNDSFLYWYNDNGHGNVNGKGDLLVLGLQETNAIWSLFFLECSMHHSLPFIQESEDLMSRVIRRAAFIQFEIQNVTIKAAILVVLTMILTFALPAISIWIAWLMTRSAEEVAEEIVDVVQQGERNWKDWSCAKVKNSSHLKKKKQNQQLNQQQWQP